MPWFPLDFQAPPFLEETFKNQEPRNPNFLGYRKDRLGVPTFHYLMHGWRVEDRLEATSDGFLHTMHLSSEPGTPPLAGILRGDFTAIGEDQYHKPPNTRITLLKGNAKVEELDGQKHLTLFMDPNEDTMEWQYLIEQTNP